MTVPDWIIRSCSSNVSLEDDDVSASCGNGGRETDAQILSKAASDVNHCLANSSVGRMSWVSSVTFWNHRLRILSKTAGLKVLRS